MEYSRLTFLYSIDGTGWTRACADLDGSILSDHHAEDWGFTGGFVELACQDLTGDRQHGDFDFFEVRELD